jgi:hypothetical protein
MGSDRPSYAVMLTYFKRTGKLYSEGNYRTRQEHMYQIFAEVRELWKARRLPGLCENHSDFVVLVNVPEHPHDHPQLIGLRNEP